MKKEPYLMPHQTEPFNGDKNVCDEFLKLKEKFNSNLAVELGCCLGGSTKWLSENFEKVIAIEINEQFLGFAKERTKAKNNIDFHLGDTLDVLPKITKKMSNRTIVFVDSHWMDNVPLLKELEIIAKAGLRPVIVIHDFKVPNRPDLGFDSYKGQDYTFEWIHPSIYAIYGEDGYSFHYNDKAEGAKRGVIYIYPKEA